AFVQLCLTAQERQHHPEATLLVGEDRVRPVALHFGHVRPQSRNLALVAAALHEQGRDSHQQNHDRDRHRGHQAGVCRPELGPATASAVRGATRLTAPVRGLPILGHYGRIRGSEVTPVVALRAARRLGRAAASAPASSRPTAQFASPAPSVHRGGLHSPLARTLFSLPERMSNALKRPVVLVVLDGWGYRAEREGNAIALANTPTWDGLWRHASRTLLEASGLAVGLPEGQMGNSEVGHTNLGAGRVVMQDIVRIDQAIRDGSFFTNPEILEACESVKRRGGTLHVMGLLGQGGVHAHDRHLRAMLQLGTPLSMPRVALHLLLDGRDTMPRSAVGYLAALLAELPPNAFIASIGG